MLYSTHRTNPCPVLRPFPHWNFPDQTKTLFLALPRPSLLAFPHIPWCLLCTLKARPSLFLTMLWSCTVPDTETSPGAHTAPLCGSNVMCTRFTDPPPTSEPEQVYVTEVLALTLCDIVSDSQCSSISSSTTNTSSSCL